LGAAAAAVAARQEAGAAAAAAADVEEGWLKMSTECQDVKAKFEASLSKNTLLESELQRVRLTISALQSEAAAAAAGTQFTCFTSTKVQILTQQQQMLHSPHHSLARWHQKKVEVVEEEAEEGSHLGRYCR